LAVGDNHFVVKKVFSKEIQCCLETCCRQGVSPSFVIILKLMVHVASSNNRCHFSAAATTAAAAAAVGEVWGGVPARFVRKLTHDEKDALKEEAVDINRAAWAVRKGESSVGTVFNPLRVGPFEEFSGF
jgi:hypothetical protein